MLAPTALSTAASSSLSTCGWLRAVTMGAEAVACAGVLTGPVTVMALSCNRELSLEAE